MVPVVPELEPLVLPEPMLPLEPVLGDVLLGELLGDVLLGEVLLGMLLVPPLAAPLLKCASHSAREIWPSLLVSTDEKLGAELDDAPALLEGRVLEPEAALPLDDVSDDEEPLDMPDEPLEPPAAEGDVDLSLLVLDEELCASATLDSANSAAAVAALSTLRFNIG